MERIRLVVMGDNKVRLFLPAKGQVTVTVHTGILMGLTGAFQDFSFEIQLNLEYLASNRLVRYQGGGVVEKFAGFSQSYFYSLGLKCTFIIYQFQYFSPISSHQSYSSPPLLLFGKICTYA